MSWDQYSQTPASNYVAPYAFTGMAPSLVKVAISNVMADLAQLQSLPTTGGTANAQTVTNTRQFGALVAGMTQWVIFGNTNTGAWTFAPDGLTAKNVFANGVASIAGQGVSGQIGLLRYDGTQWNLINPSRAIGSFTITLATGLTTTPTGTINYAVGNDGKSITAWATSSITGTSNTTGMTGTGVPAIIQAVTDKEPQCVLEDNGGGCSGGVRVGASSGTWTFTKGGTPPGFTGSAVKGVIARMIISYTND